MNESEIKKFNLLVKAEPFIIIAAVIGLCFKLMHWNYAGLILIISLSTLSISYFFRILIPPETQNASKLIFTNKLGAIGLSVAVNGILFRLMAWAGSDTMLMTGVGAIVFSLSAILYFRNQSENENVFSSKQIARLIIVGSIAGLLATVSDINIVKFFHKDDPEYVRLFTNYRQNLKDTVASNAFRNYLNKK